jgi:hypothetical protein
MNQKITSYGVGPKKMSEYDVYIGLYKKHVNLGFYHGAVLSDLAGFSKAQENVSVMLKSCVLLRP